MEIDARSLEEPDLEAQIAAYAAQQLQVKGGILIGIRDEQELAANTAFWQPIVKATGYKITN